MSPAALQPNSAQRGRSPGVSVYVAGAHCEHSGELGRLAKKPVGQGWQSAAPVSFRPVADPAGQLLHLLSVAPSGFHVPTGQGTHSVAPSPSTFTVIQPAGQAVHAATAEVLE